MSLKATSLSIAGLDPAIHATPQPLAGAPWMAGSSPAMEERFEARELERSRKPAPSGRLDEGESGGASKNARACGRLPAGESHAPTKKPGAMKNEPQMNFLFRVHSMLGAYCVAMC